jgi:ATP-binding cassette, subfamily C (CFTR/MRP), member 1
MSSRLGKYVTIAQKRWLSAIEKRVNFTSEIFGSIKSVKMLGLVDRMAMLIEKMRRDEIVVMKKSRFLWSINVCISRYRPSAGLSSDQY